jgi:hypothetical protein
LELGGIRSLRVEQFLRLSASRSAITTSIISRRIITAYTAYGLGIILLGVLKPI